MVKRKHLIIGCGPAGLSALKQIRKLGSKDEVKLISMEDTTPYSPVSLPYLLSGSKKESDIFLTEEGFFQKMNATLMKGMRVEKVMPREKQVLLESGERESFDTLLIASGSEPVRPRIKGLNGDNFLGFHTLGDYRDLVSRLEKEKEAAILGGGYVGMEVAEALYERGHKPTIFEKENGVLPLSFERVVGDYVSQIYSEKGIDIYAGTEVSEIRSGEDFLEIVCGDGRRFKTDLLVTCVGVKSRIAMLEGSGIEVNHGILVDKRMRTNAEEIYAAGDVAEAPDFISGRNGLSPISPSAVDQGKIAGSNMVGEAAEYHGWLSMNLYNFFGHLAVSMGQFTHSYGNEVFINKDDGNRSYRKIVCRDNLLVGANFFNVELDAGVMQYLIRNKIDIGPYKESLLEKPKEVSLWLMLEAEKKNTTSLEG